MAEEALWRVSTLLLYVFVALATHLLVSFGQTLMHREIAHKRRGGRFFRNHVSFHHAHYSGDHLVSDIYLSGKGNNTPYFLIPMTLINLVAYFELPFNLFLIIAVAGAASFYLHVLFDKEYHVRASWLQRFAWFRRRQELHFVHHRHANCNFAVVHFFWDKMLGSYRQPYSPKAEIEPKALSSALITTAERAMFSFTWRIAFVKAVWRK